MCSARLTAGEVGTGQRPPPSLALPQFRERVHMRHAEPTLGKRQRRTPGSGGLGELPQSRAAVPPHRCTAPRPTPLPSLLFPLANPRASLVARLVNDRPAMQETGSIPGSGRFGGEGIGYPCQVLETSLVAKTVKNLPAMWETWVRSWFGKIPWRREQLWTSVFWPEFHGQCSLVGCSPWGRKELHTTERFFTFTSLSKSCTLFPSSLAPASGLKAKFKVKLSIPSVKLWLMKNKFFSLQGYNCIDLGKNYAYLKITADGDCSHEIKRCLLLGRKVMTNLDSILKSRDITLPTKVSLVKAMVFPVVMCGCESWTIKKAEH